MNGLMTTAEIAEHWGCTQQWVQALIKRGDLKATLFGKTYLVDAAEVREFRRRPLGRPPENGKAHVSPAAKRSQKKRAGRGARK